MTISRFRKACIVGVCITAVSAGAVFANQQYFEILPISSVAVKAEDGVRILIDGQLIKTDAVPFIEAGRTLVPIRGIMEKIGATVEWNAETETVSVEAGHITLELVIGQKVAKLTRIVDGKAQLQEVTLDVAAKLVEGRSFIPLRFIAEALGAEVGWDEANKVVTIDTAEDEIIFEIERPISYEVVNTIKLENKELEKWYNEKHKQQGIHSYTDGKWHYVLVAGGEQNTGGYSMEINSMTLVSKAIAYVDATLITPGKEAIVTQAFTYPNLLIRFEGEADIEIQGDINEISQDDVIVGEIGPSPIELGKAIDIEAVVEMKLYSLMQKELKTFSKSEIKDIITKINSSPTYDGPVLMMLAGNSITIKLAGKDTIQLSSYGNEEHVLVGGQIDGESFGYCVVNSEIGRLLLEK